MRYFFHFHDEVQQLSTGFARSLSKLSLDGEKLLRVVREMLSSTQYTNAVLRVHDIYIDRPMESLSEAVFWTNRSLRIGSRKPTFKRKGMFLSSTTYFYLPHLSGVLFAIIISYKLWAFLWHYSQRDSVENSFSVLESFEYTKTKVSFSCTVAWILLETFNWHHLFNLSTSNCKFPL